MHACHSRGGALSLTPSGPRAAGSGGGVRWRVVRVRARGLRVGRGGRAACCVGCRAVRRCRDLERGSLVFCRGRSPSRVLEARGGSRPWDGMGRGGDQGCVRAGGQRRDGEEGGDVGAALARCVCLGGGRLGGQAGADARAQGELLPRWQRPARRLELASCTCAPGAHIRRPEAASAWAGVIGRLRVGWSEWERLGRRLCGARHGRGGRRPCVAHHNICVCYKTF